MTSVTRNYPVANPICLVVIDTIESVAKASLKNGFSHAQIDSKPFFSASWATEIVALTGVLFCVVIATRIQHQLNEYALE